MKRLGIVSAAIISVVMLATSAFAQDLNKGWDAYEAGDPRQHHLVSGNTQCQILWASS